jgi:lysosomal acid lipase/cholesteryl ester hydrolase
VATLLIVGQTSQAQLASMPFGGLSMGGSAGEAANRDRLKLPISPSQGDSSPQVLEILKARGFIGELYKIQARDKAPISVYHIINPYADQRRLNRYPVLVFHGLAADATQMLAHSERTQARPPVPGQIVVEPGDTSLALLLANNNFDVFLADARGANLNNHMMVYDVDPLEGQKYWNFSLDEQIHYDLPATIDFVLEQTHSDKLHYIGFSESTFFMFALLTRFVEYQNKLASFVALAPVAYVGHISGLALSLFTLSGLVPETFNANYLPQPVSDTIGVGVRRICNNPLLFKTVCGLFASGVSGTGNEEESRDLYMTLMKSTSIKALKHFLQLYQQKRFGMYDYGPLANVRHYGTVRPPDYDLSKIKVPSIVLFRGATDFLSNAVDQRLLLAQLGTKPYRDYNYPNYNHIGFLSGRTVVNDVNLPAANAMFELLKINAAKSGVKSIFKETQPAGAPETKRQPVAVSHPDGSHSIRFKSNLISNILNGFVESNGAKRVGMILGAAPVSGIAPNAQALLQKQWDMLQNIDEQVQNIGSESLNWDKFKLPIQVPVFG